MRTCIIGRKMKKEVRHEEHLSPDCAALADVYKRQVQSIRVRGKKELDITFTHEDEYKKALQLLALAAQQKDYEQRKVG